MTSKKHARLEKSYDILCQKEKLKEGFTTHQIAEEVGWRPKTTSTYPSKKWKPFLKKDESLYFVDGLVGKYTKEQYLRLMSQKDELSNDPMRPDLPEAVERLILKSRDAAILAVEVYNRPASHFRTESFLVNMTIAWTSLFHAIFENSETDYLYKDAEGNHEYIDGDKKAWELSKCVKEYFGGEQSAIKENLLFTIKLRNRIEHRYIPLIDMHVAGECQALLLNYDDIICKTFGEYWAIQDALFVPLQIAKSRSRYSWDAQKRFQAENFDILSEFIDAYRDGLPDEIYQDPKYSFRVYLVPKVGNHASSSDVAFEFVKYDSSKPKEMEELEKMVALIKHKNVQVANQGLYKPSIVAKKVRTETGKSFRTHHHTNAWKLYQIRGRGIDPDSCKTQYCQFDDAHEDYIYTDDWVSFLITQVQDDEEYQRIISYRG